MISKRAFLFLLPFYFSTLSVYSMETPRTYKEITWTDQELETIATIVQQLGNYRKNHKKMPTPQKKTTRSRRSSNQPTKKRKIKPRTTFQCRYCLKIIVNINTITPQALESLTFSSLQELNTHKKLFHNNVAFDPFCQQCNRYFTLVVNYIAHLQDFHIKKTLKSITD